MVFYGVPVLKCVKLLKLKTLNTKIGVETDISLNLVRGGCRKHNIISLVRRGLRGRGEWQDGKQGYTMRVG